MITAVALLLVAGAWGQTAYEGFGNGPLATLDGSAGGQGWASPWSDINSSQLTAVTGPGLSFPGLRAEPGAAITPEGGSFDAAQLMRWLPAFPAGTSTVYVSFLLRADGQSLYGGLSFNAYPRTVYVGYPMGQYMLGLRWGRYVFVDTTVPLVVGRTNFLVLETTQNAATTSYRLYVDPAPGGAKPAYPNAEYTVGGIEPLPSWIELNNDGGFTTDEIRVGTSWASVTPAAITCAADVGMQGGIPGSDGVLDNNDFVIFIAHFFSQNPGADVGSTGGVPGPDGRFDNNDFVAFVDLFFAGC